MPTTTRKTTARKPAPRRRSVVLDKVDEVIEADTRTAWLLRSEWQQHDGVEYFYDGELPVKGGVITVPLDRHDWVSRLLFSGYTFVNERDLTAFDKAIAEA